MLIQTVFDIHMPAVETQDKIIKKNFERESGEIFQGTAS
jgi:hypothetical protein